MGLTVAPKLLLIGGAGSIGSRIVRGLGATHELLVLDEQPLDPEAGRLAAYEPCSVLEPACLEAAARAVGGGWHAIYLVGLQDNDTTSEGLHRNFRLNVEAVERTLLALRDSLTWFTYLSTVSVYGPAEVLPVRVTETLAPSTPYGVCKAAGEILARGLSGILDIPCTVLRLAQVYGIPSARACLPHAVLRAVLRDEPLRLTCEPGIKRHFLSCDDLVRLIGLHAREPRPGTFNVAAAEPTTVGEIFAAALERGRGDQGWEGVLEDWRAAGGDAGGRVFDQWLDVAELGPAFGFLPEEGVCAWIRRAANAEIQ